MKENLLNSDVVELFSRTSKRVFKPRRRVYTEELVCWLMIRQRLQGDATLRGAVDTLLRDGANQFIGRCKRQREGRISANTGAYSQARMELTVEATEELADEIFTELSPEGPEWHGRKVYGVDGTTLRLEHYRELAEKYPPCRNRHWPLMLTVVAHDLMTGYALRPVWGPMYGDEAQSETRLVRGMFERFPKGSVIVGDRNFGIYSVVFYAVKSGQDVVVRLNEKVARKLLGGDGFNGLDKEVLWRPSRTDLRTNEELNDDLPVLGRVIVQVIRREEKEVRLCLFTTIKNVSAEEIVALYGRRWELEVDLRHLKKTVNLDLIRGKSPDIVEKELVLGVIAYNLVRAINTLAAEKIGVKPREISFVSTLHLIRSFSDDMLATKSLNQRRKVLDQLLRLAANRINRKRKRRAYPRTAWKVAPTYPPKKLAIMGKN